MPKKGQTESNDPNKEVRRSRLTDGYKRHGVCVVHLAIPVDQRAWFVEQAAKVLAKHKKQLGIKTWSD